MKKHIPNIVTLMNLACGCIGIMLVSQGEVYWGALMVFFGAAFDFADGFVARALNVSSKLGAELDSLSDCVTFGVLPSMLLIHILAYDAINTVGIYQQAPIFILAMASAYRLAKFNVSTEQTTSFLGVPTPATGIFVASYALAYETTCSLSTSAINEYAFSPIAVYAIVAIFSLLMISNIPMFAMKVKGIGWKGNEFRYLLIIGAIPLIVIFKFAGVSLAILLYILLSITENLVRR